MHHLPRILLVSICSVTALFASPAAHAQLGPQSLFAVELSHDGTTWTDHLDVAAHAGARVFGRVTARFISNGGPEPLFLGQARIQPTVSNWEPLSGDTVVPFDPVGRVEADYFTNPPVLGRTFGSTTVQAVQAHQYVFEGESYLRFAEAAALNHPGQGAGSNNRTGAAGINLSNSILSPTPGLRGVVLFTWGMDFLTDRVTDEQSHLRFTIPMEGYRTSSASANPPNTRSATWITSVSPVTSIEAPVVPTLSATLTLNIPSPGMLAQVGSAVFVLCARPRRRAPFLST